MRINHMGPINPLGYGVASLNILKALQKKAEVSLHMIGQPQVTTQEDANAVRLGLSNAGHFDANAPCVKIWHQNQMSERIGVGKFVGFPIFELDTFNEIERHHLSSCHEIMVCSEWAKGVVQKHLEKPVHVVPLGVDMETFKPSPSRQRDGKIIFFNCGKWEIRKGHDVLIEAFKKVETLHKNVELWMMTTNPFNSEEENARWSQLYNHPKVKFIPRAETHAEVYNIMTNVDCGVFPSRGEGWNLELLEMMAVGKHVIATDYSAHTEFCNQDNCGLIPISDTEPAYDGKWFFGQGNWAKIGGEEVDILVEKMSNFIQSYNGEVNEAGIETAKRFTWENSANKILEALNG